MKLKKVFLSIFISSASFSLTSCSFESSTKKAWFYDATGNYLDCVTFKKEDCGVGKTRLDNEPDAPTGSHWPDYSQDLTEFKTFSVRAESDYELKYYAKFVADGETCRETKEKMYINEIRSWARTNDVNVPTKEGYIGMWDYANYTFDSKDKTIIIIRPIYVNAELIQDIKIEGIPEWAQGLIDTDSLISVLQKVKVSEWAEIINTAIQNLEYAGGGAGYDYDYEIDIDAAGNATIMITEEYHEFDIEYWIYEGSSFEDSAKYVKTETIPYSLKIYDPYDPTSLSDYVISNAPSLTKLDNKYEDELIRESTSTWRLFEDYDDWGDNPRNIVAKVWYKPISSTYHNAYFLASEDTKEYYPAIPFSELTTAETLIQMGVDKGYNPINDDNEWTTDEWETPTDLTKDVYIDTKHTLTDFTATWYDDDNLATAKSLYTCKFNRNSAGESASLDVLKGWVIDQYKDKPEKDGYTFNEWLSNPREFGAHDIIYYPVYSPNTYTATFVGADENDKTIGFTVKNTWQNIQDKAPDVPAKQGDDSEWYSGEWDYGEHKSSEYMPPENVEIQPKYTEKKFTATFKDKDGGELKTQEFTRTSAGESASLDVLKGWIKAQAPTAPAVTGYKFKDWELCGEEFGAHNLTYKATYEGKKSTITFTSLGKTLGGTIEATYGNEYDFSQKDKQTNDYFLHESWVDKKNNVTYYPSDYKSKTWACEDETVTLDEVFVQGFESNINISINYKTGTAGSISFNDKVIFNINYSNSSKIELSDDCFNQGKQSLRLETSQTLAIQFSQGFKTYLSELPNCDGVSYDANIDGEWETIKVSLDDKFCDEVTLSKSYHPVIYLDNMKLMFK